MSSGGQVAKLSYYSLISTACLMCNHRQDSYSWVYNSSSRQLCPFTGFVDPVKLDVEGLRSEMGRQYGFGEVMNEFFSKGIEDINGSDIENFGCPIQVSVTM